MIRSGLAIKSVKCAVFYGRRSGNNWYNYKGKKDTKPVIEIQSQVLPFKTNECYKYLGKSLSLSGEDNEQINEIVVN